MGRGNFKGEEAAHYKVQGIWSTCVGDAAFLSNYVDYLFKMFTIIWSTVDISSCTYNLALCHADQTGCRQQAARMIDACAWNVSGGHCADVVRCRDAVRRFYTTHAPDRERFRSLLFCHCEHGDQLCTSVRRAFHPACTAIQLPPPSCHDVINTCNQDADCRYYIYMSSRILEKPRDAS